MIVNQCFLSAFLLQWSQEIQKSKSYININDYFVQKKNKYQKHTELGRHNLLCMNSSNNLYCICEIFEVYKPWARIYLKKSYIIKCMVSLILKMYRQTDTFIQVKLFINRKKMLHWIWLWQNYIIILFDPKVLKTFKHLKYEIQTSTQSNSFSLICSIEQKEYSFRISHGTI